MFIKVGSKSIKKETENAYGDCILIKRYKNSDKIIAVLSDGLGSGIKANILSTMTSTMLLGFAQKEEDLTAACEIVMNSLPVCKVRGISYSTFSVVIADSEGNVKVIEEGNPDFLFIRNNKVLAPDYTIVDSKTHKERHLKVYKLKLEIKDTLVFTSDGVTQAALGSKNLKNGLQREGLIEIVLKYLESHPDFSPDDLAFQIINTSRLLSENHRAHDDISALVLHADNPREALIFTGPPYDEEKDFSWAKMFEDFKGKKAISGGTTAKILSRQLNKELVTNQESKGNLPSISFMEGCDLITEGVLTLTRAYEYLLEGNFEDKDDAAADLIKFMMEADNINFVVGAKVNSAHYDPNLPVEIELRKDVVKKIIKILRERYLKKIEVQYL